MYCNFSSKNCRYGGGQWYKGCNILLDAVLRLTNRPKSEIGGNVSSNCKLKLTRIKYHWRVIVTPSIPSGRGLTIIRNTEEDLHQQLFERSFQRSAPEGDLGAQKRSLILLHPYEDPFPLISPSSRGGMVNGVTTTVCKSWRPPPNDDNPLPKC